MTWKIFPLVYENDICEINGEPVSCYLHILQVVGWEEEILHAKFMTSCYFSPL